MINEIVEKYEKFSDSLISEFTFKSSEIDQIEIVIKCRNANRNYEWELVRLMFNDVFEFRFVSLANMSSVVINSALIKQENGFIIVDFFPLIFANDNLKENIQSDLIIKCKELKYSV